jgi:hypothetical protein
VSEESSDVPSERSRPRDEAEELAAADAVDTRIAAVWGPQAVAWMHERPAVQHVLAVVQPEGSDMLHVLRIAPGGPSHPDDAFSLALARARADQILLTAQILREEPELTYAYGVGPDAAHDPGAAGGLASWQLAAWRRLRLRRVDPPELVIITKRGDVPAGHPIFKGNWPVRVLAPVGVVATLRESLPNQVQVEALSELEATSPIAVVDRLRAEASKHRGHVLSIEAGPSFARALYPEDGIPKCDEVLLSEVAAVSVAEAFVGPRWIPRQRLAREYGWMRTANEGSAWSFALGRLMPPRAVDLRRTT